MSFDYLTGYIMSISMCMQNFITIFLSVQEIGPFSLFQNLELGKASTDVKISHSVQEKGLFSLFQKLALGKASTNDKCHFAISWTRCRQYQCVCKMLSKHSKRFRVIDIVHVQSGDKIFTNCPVKNQMFDYRAHNESQSSVSVDFLRVVQ